jgi:hypothetical protein
VETGTGDNHTSWETLRYNIRMGLGLAMSGISNTGHDIGGFSGPAPGPELLLRWVQYGIFLPRFSIHSWNDDQTVNEPWMHPDVTPQVRELIKHEDDGLSQACRADAYGQWRLRVSCTLSGPHLAVSREGPWPPVQDRMVLRLPRSDARTLGFTGAVLEEDVPEGDWRRLTLQLVDWSPRSDCIWAACAAALGLRWLSFPVQRRDHVQLPAPACRPPVGGLLHPGPGRRQQCHRHALRHRPAESG